MDIKDKVDGLLKRIDHQVLNKASNEKLAKLHEILQDILHENKKAEASEEFYRSLLDKKE